ncbi:MAG: flavodoxin [Eubacteriales bacterium]|nr:flavodoxin [Eubacteriales bacterium]
MLERLAVDENGMVEFDYSIFEKKSRICSTYDTKSCTLETREQGYSEFGVTMNLIMALIECNRSIIPRSRPTVEAIRDNMDEYDVIFVGFPIWRYVAPTIINTFLEQHDLAGKTIIPFATSGGSGMGKTNEALKPSCPASNLLEGRVFKRNVSKEELAGWANKF